MEEETGKENEYKLPEEKIEDMIKDIRELGFKVEETDEGELKISNSPNF